MVQAYFLLHADKEKDKIIGWLFEGEVFFCIYSKFFNNTETDNVTDKLHIGPEQQYSLYWR